MTATRNFRPILAAAGTSRYWPISAELRAQIAVDIDPTTSAVSSPD